MDFTIFYKERFGPSDWAPRFNWDLFLSAFNSTERVKHVFDIARAREKVWVGHHEYGFELADYPAGTRVCVPASREREDDFIRELFGAVISPNASGAIGIDISGFMRPHLMFLVKFLKLNGIRAFDVLYSEPSRYAARERTRFADGEVREVRPVAGFEGAHVPLSGDAYDSLIIAAGYEHELVRRVALAKQQTRKLQLLGFPSLQADFYQENVLNVHRAAESLSATNATAPLYAPANDPFVTAAVVSETVERQRQLGATNFYLCPISSRPQALGIALYHTLGTQPSDPVSVIYPFSTRYFRDSAVGVSRVWHYRVEFP